MPIPDPIPFSGRPDQINPGAIPPHLLTTQPQAAPPTEYASQTKMHPVFDRLKWSILDPLPDVQILVVDAQGEPQLQPFFEGPESASAEEPVTEPPNARLHILIEPLNSWHQWRDKKHLKPTPGLIESTGGRPISVKQFMQAIHNYAAPMRKLLCQSTDIDSPSDIPRAKFYFDLTMGGGSKDQQRPFPQLQVHVLEHPTGEGDRSDLDWKSLNNRLGYLLISLQGRAAAEHISRRPYPDHLTLHLGSQTISDRAKLLCLTQKPIYQIKDATMSPEIPQMDWYPPKWNTADIPPHLLMSGPPPEPPQSSGSEPKEVFNRLKWSVLDPPSDVLVFGRDEEGLLQWRPLFDESNKSLFNGAAVDPPQSRLEVAIEPLHNWWHWHDSETQHLRPSQLLVENADDQPISVEQFIRAVHGYAIPLRKLLLRCTDIRDPQNQDRARFFFDIITRGLDGEIPGQRNLDVNVSEDPTGDGEKCAWIWEDMETRVKNQPASQ